MSTRKAVNNPYAKMIAKRIGWSITVLDGEYRVNKLGGKEATAYYTTDLIDACETMLAEAKRNGQY